MLHWTGHDWIRPDQQPQTKNNKWNKKQLQTPNQTQNSKPNKNTQIPEQTKNSKAKSQILNQNKNLRHQTQNSQTPNLVPKSQTKQKKKK